MPPVTTLRVGFIRPELGLGGGERLILDACVGLAERAHKIDIYTTQYDPNRCFEETKLGLFNIKVLPSWLFPASLFGLLPSFCLAVRTIMAAIWICLDALLGRKHFDAIIVDGVVEAAPIVRLLLGCPVLFYLHWPYTFLCPKDNILQRLVRRPLDALEESSTAVSDTVLVNSRFTREAFWEAYPTLREAGVEPQVLYPCVPIPPKPSLGPQPSQSDMASLLGSDGAAEFLEEPGAKIFLSVNRIDRQKSLPLALRALSLLLERRPGCGARLVIAGGLDRRVSDNAAHFEELVAEAAALGVSDKVLFITCFDDRTRAALFRASQAVLYTSQNEHFGIGVIEAGAAARPVIACASGGPLESVVAGETGLLCDATPMAFSLAMEKLLDPDLSRRMGSAAYDHVAAHFSREAFAAALEAHIRQALQALKPEARRLDKFRTGYAKASPAGPRPSRQSLLRRLRLGLGLEGSGAAAGLSNGFHDEGAEMAQALALEWASPGLGLGASLGNGSGGGSGDGSLCGGQTELSSAGVGSTGGPSPTSGYSNGDADVGGVRALSL